MDPPEHQGEHLVEHLAEQLAVPLPEVDPTKIQRRLDYIDVLRAVAVLAVFGVHIWGYWLHSPLKAAHSFSPDGLVLRFISLGAFGVDLFIVISGFCLAYPLLKGTDRSSPPRGLKTGAFYKRRAFRILPAYYAALLVIFLVELIPAAQRDLVAHPVTLWDLASHALLIQTWFPSTIGAINGPFWSIALEVQLYLVFPLLLFSVRRFGFLRTLFGTMVLSLIWFGLTALWVHHGLQNTFGPDLSKELPARWFEFMFGVGAARLVTAPRDHDLRIGIAATLVGVPLALGSESLNSNLGRAFGWGLLAVGMVLLGSFVPHRFILGNPLGKESPEAGGDLVQLLSHPPTGPPAPLAGGPQASPRPDGGRAPRIHRGRRNHCGSSQGLLHPGRKAVSRSWRNASGDRLHKGLTARSDQESIVAVDTKVLRCSGVPIEVGGPLRTAASQIGGEFAIVEHPSETGGQRLTVGFDEQRRIGTHFGERTTTGGDDRHATCHTLEGGQPEPLVDRRHHHRRGPAHHRGNHRRLKPPRKHHVLEPVEEGISTRIGWAADRELNSWMSGCHTSPGISQSQEVLPIAGPGGVEHERGGNPAMPVRGQSRPCSPCSPHSLRRESSRRHFDRWRRQSPPLQTSSGR